MPKQKYAITRSGPKRLEIAYPFGMGKVTVRLDGKDLGTIEGRQALKAGGNVKLPDGSTVNIKLASNLLGSELHVSRNGRPVAGSAGDPHKRLADASSAFYLIAAVNIVVGLGTAVFRLSFLQAVSGGWFSVIFGLIFAGIGYGVGDGSRTVLGVGLLIFLVDTGLLVGATLTEGHPLGVVGMLLRVYLLLMMIRGAPAIDGVKAETVEDEADIRAAKNLPPQNPPPIWSDLEKSLLVVVCIMVMGLTSVLSMLNNRSAPRQMVMRPTDVPPTAGPTITPGGPTLTPMPIPVAVIEYPDSVLSGLGDDIRETNQLPHVRLVYSKSDKDSFAGNLTWQTMTFYSGLNADGYLAESDGAWMFVDLRERILVHQLIVSSFVDTRFNDAPITLFVGSMDLETWHILAAETNYANSYGRFKPRVINLERDVYMRYVGLYAFDWNGGLGRVEIFAVIAPGYDYTTEGLQEAAR